MASCIDLGHLWGGGYDADVHLKRYLHLHGVGEGHDHLALTALPSDRLCQLLNSIGNFAGVLTLEIFNYEKARDSILCLNQLSQP